VEVTGDGEGLVSFAGAQLLIDTAHATGLGYALKTALANWRRDRTRHDPGKVVLDLGASIAIGGDCLADVAVLREQPAVFGAVASDPTVSRCIDALAGDVDAALAGLRSARAQARARSWAHRRPVAGEPGSEVIVDLDATVVVAHSEKESAAPTFKRTFGFHPLLAFCDHGPEGTGEPLAALLRRGSANANTAADHITVLDLALAQLPAAERGSVLVRGDSGAGTKAFLAHITALGLAFSVGFPATDPVAAAIELVPPAAWTPAYDGDGQPREGAEVAELTGLLPRLTDVGWPPAMRVVARRERPHPGAQLRLTDHEGWRITLFATNTLGGQLADLELRHRQRARAEDRIRGLKDSGLRNLPLHDLAQNKIWLELVLLAGDLLSWTQTLAMSDTPARRWEPKRLRLRLFAVAGRLVRSGRRTRLKLAKTWRWTPLVVNGANTLQALPGT
jgi:hypothetical protein